MQFGNRVNLHTHTIRCKHACGTIDEYCREAIRQGVATLGFSDHAPFPDGRFGRSRMEYGELEEYRADLERVRKEFPQLRILAGLEVDYLPSVGKAFYEETFIPLFDYLIVGVHFIEPVRPENNLWLPGNVISFDVMRAYAEATVAAMESGLFRYIAHPDMFCWQCQRWTPEVAALCRTIADAAVSLDIPLEINAYGLRKPWVDTPEGRRPGYPYRPFWELVASRGARVVVGADAHRPEDVWGNTDEAVAFARELGLEPVNTEVAAAIRPRKVREEA